MASGLSLTPVVTTCLLTFFVGSAANSVAAVSSPMYRRQHESTSVVFSPNNQMAAPVRNSSIPTYQEMFTTPSFSSPGMVIKHSTCILHSMSSTTSSPHLPRGPRIGLPFPLHRALMILSYVFYMPFLNIGSVCLGTTYPNNLHSSQQSLVTTDCTLLYIPFLCVLWVVDGA